MVVGRAGLVLPSLVARAERVDADADRLSRFTHRQIGLHRPSLLSGYSALAGEAPRTPATSERTIVCGYGHGMHCRRAQPADDLVQVGARLGGEISQHGVKSDGSNGLEIGRPLD